MSDDTSIMPAIAGASGGLPDPYGVGFEESVSQLELTKEIFEKINEDIVLGAEMYETDDQLILNEYLGGHYDYKIFAKEAKVWPNDQTDYLPLLNFARSNQLSFIATNTPRRYANMVYKNGFKAFNHLTESAKKSNKLHR